MLNRIRRGLRGPASMFLCAFVLSLVPAVSEAAGGYTTTVTVPATNQAGAGVSFSVQVSSVTATSALIDLEVYGPNGGRVLQQVWDRQVLNAGASLTLSTTWASPSSAVTGTYTAKVGVFGPGWAGLRDWNDRAATFTLTAAGSGPPNAAYSSTAVVTPTTPTAGSPVSITARVTSPLTRSALIDVEVYGPTGAKVHQQAFDNQALTAGQPYAVTAVWPVAATAAAGSYRVKIGVFAPGWGGVLHWNDAAATVAVSAATQQRFVTLPPGAALPSGTECAARVRRSSWEPRPENAAANTTRPSSAQIAAIVPWTRATVGVDDRADVLRRRIDGNFTGTTDEIIQWGACKWGLDEDIVRAVAVVESWWRQSTQGDYNPATNQFESYGLLQVRMTAHKVTFPASRDSTAFNVDYALASRRSCFEGYVLWLNDVQPGAGYGAGDEWGCVGLWFSGRWKDGGALGYIAEVQRRLSERTWMQAGF